MNEGEKFLISLSIVVIGMFGIPLCYLLYRSWKIAKIMQMARHLEREKERANE